MKSSSRSSSNGLLDGNFVQSYSGHMALNLTPSTEAQLHHLAAETHRSAEELAESAVQALFAEYEEIRREVEEADREFERGEFLPHEEVVALFAKRFAKS